MKRLTFLIVAGFVAWASAATALAQRPTDSTRKYLIERVDDVAVVQLYAYGFKDLPLKEKLLVWHLYQAALAGRDNEQQALLELDDRLPHSPGVEVIASAGGQALHGRRDRRQVLGVFPFEIP